MSNTKTKSWIANWKDLFLSQDTITIEKHIEYGAGAFNRGFDGAEFDKFMTELSHSPPNFFRKVAFGILKSQKIQNFFDNNSIVLGSGVLASLNKHKLFDGIWYEPLIRESDKALEKNNSPLFNSKVPADYILKYCKNFSLVADSQREQVSKNLLACLDSIVTTNFKEFYKNQAIILNELNRNGSGAEAFYKFLSTAIEKNRLGNDLPGTKQIRKVVL